MCPPALKRPWRQAENVKESENNRACSAGADESLGQHNYAYIVECSDGSYYAGWTNDLETRIRHHNEGKQGAKYTRSRRPVTLVYYEEFATPQEAMSREWHIKRLSRSEKEELVKGFSPAALKNKTNKERC